MVPTPNLGTAGKNQKIFGIKENRMIKYTVKRRDFPSFVQMDIQRLNDRLNYLEVIEDEYWSLMELLEICLEFEPDGTKELKIRLSPSAMLALENPTIAEIMKLHYEKRKQIESERKRI